jgi:ADP-heptose:LPS heptosyltransferase
LFSEIEQIKLNNICILRLSAIGDVCHAVAAVQAIQLRHPEASITWIIGKIEYKLLEGLAGIEFVIFDKSQGRQAYKKLKSDLNGNEFDVLLHMQVSLRANIAAKFIRAKRKPKHMYLKVFSPSLKKLAFQNMRNINCIGIFLSHQTIFSWQKCIFQIDNTLLLLRLLPAKQKETGL